MRTFLQSREWEELQKRLGRKTRRLNGALCVVHALPFGLSYLYSARPDISEGEREQFFNEAQKIGKAEGMFFLKIDPIDTMIGGKGVPSNALQPQFSLLIDLSKTNEELLSEMHPKTRYNIKLAEKRGVRVEIADNAREKERYFEDFWKMLEETALRDGFMPHEKKYYEELLRVDSAECKNILFLAFYNEELLAAAIVNIYDSTATYLHGASSKKFREMMAPHALQWAIMQEARKQKCSTYDFWGIDHVKWPGVTRFKKGFGGREISYPESFDVVYRTGWYFLYRLRKKFI
jgi:peptidoglycan pentaglycine glycine transferase (the first glycine)